MALPNGFGGYSIFGGGCCGDFGGFGMPYMSKYYQYGALFSSIRGATATLTSCIKSIFSKNPTPTPQYGNYNFYGNFGNYGNYGGASNYNFYNPPIVPRYSAGSNGGSAGYNEPIVPQTNTSKSSGSNSGIRSAQEATDAIEQQAQAQLQAQKDKDKADNNTDDNDNDNNSRPAGTKKDLDKDKYGPKFLEKVKEIAKKLNCNYRDLLAIMNQESGINAACRSENSSAVGLIQFMENTATGLGTTSDKLVKMTPLEQLEYVEKCFVASKSMAGYGENDKLSAADLYALIFYPKNAKQEDLITKSNSDEETAYNANTVADVNQDGKITKTELASFLKDKYVTDDSFAA